MRVNFLPFLIISLLCFPAFAEEPKAIEGLWESKGKTLTYCYRILNMSQAKKLRPADDYQRFQKEIQKNGLYLTPEEKSEGHSIRKEIDERLADYSVIDDKKTVEEVDAFLNEEYKDCEDYALKILNENAPEGGPFYVKGSSFLHDSLGEESIPDYCELIESKYTLFENSENTLSYKEIRDLFSEEFDKLSITSTPRVKATFLQKISNGNTKRFLESDIEVCEKMQTLDINKDEDDDEIESEENNG